MTKPIQAAGEELRADLTALTEAMTRGVPVAWPETAWPADGPAAKAAAYWVDAWQRSILFWDVMRQRGNVFLKHEEEGKPPVLSFDFEMVLDGRTLDRPVNYALVRIVPPPDLPPADPVKRPFIVVDPRAGHGPGIGGSKADSQIGFALRAGHPCYFVGFLPEPMPGQTMEDIGRAEAMFIDTVRDRHPEAEGKPCIVGNCQAGWAVMMLCAARPEATGPVLINGAPISYWAGVEGGSPMRYLGGLAGGSWAASFASDLGNGRFDGANLVANFEAHNPANTFWKKWYNVYSKVDTEGPRFLDFEKWWGGYFLLNAEEMRFIVNELFVGNKLTAGGIVTSAGRRIDLRNIRAPIVVFCSFGDDITPPQQALNWILDLYDSVAEIRAREQTIVYLLHEDIGHLGIFTSGRVARKEQAQLVQTLDMIDMLPPGLYQMIISEKRPDDSAADLVAGDYLVRFEPRTLDDIRALDDTRAEEQRFRTVARMSEINEGLYLTLVSPWVRAWSSEALANWLRRTHPARLQYTLASDRNPAMAPVAALAETVRQDRRPVGPDHPLLAAERMMSDQIVAWLETVSKVRDGWSELLFKTIYSNPWLEAALGLRSWEAQTAPRRARDEAHETLVATKIAALKARVGQGGLREAVFRILAYVAKGDAVYDVRPFRMMQQIREELPAEQRLSPAEAKEVIKEQVFMMLLDEEGAMAALPALLPAAEDRRTALDLVRRIATTRGPLSAEHEARLHRVETMLGIGSA